MIDSVFLHT